MNENKSSPLAASKDALGQKKPAASRLAKLSIPKVETAIQRERLFEILDGELAKRSLVWIHAAPGAGKTTLAGTYLAQSSRQVLWYRVDGGDSDLPTFFSHLREAVLAITAEASALPVLSPEYLLGVPTFARNFFRALFGLLRHSAVLVIDNYQDAGEGTLDAVVTMAVEELPNHINVLILSRTAPPPAFAALQMRNALATVEWQKLRLTLDEARAIALTSNVTDWATVDDLYSSCDGWVAGLVLLLEYTKQVGTPKAHGAAQARETLFSYFSNELFNSVPAATQRLLLCMALLPGFTAQQVAIFAPPDEAQRTLEWLQRRNFFIDYSQGAQRTYRYHALFREFLLERGRAFFPPAERQALLLLAAGAFESNGQAEIATALAIEAHAWQKAGALICMLAPALLRQGRMSTLERFVNGLPAERLDEMPWVRYWLGLSKVPFSPPEGRKHLEVAYTGFESVGDALGRVMACSGVLQSFFVEWADQRGADRWIEILSELLERGEFPCPIEVEAVIVTALPGMLLRNLEHPLAARLVERAYNSYRRTDIMDLRVTMAAVAVWYFGMAGPVSRSAQITEEINAAIERRELSPLTLIQWSMLEIFHAHVGFRMADYEARLATIDRVLELARSTGIHVMDATAAGQCVYVTLKANDLPRAEKYLRVIASTLSMQRPLDEAQFLWHQSAVALLRGDVLAAHASILECLRKSDALGCTFGSAQARLLLVCTWMLQKQNDQAKAEVKVLLEATHTLKSQPLEYSARLLRAYVLLECGDRDDGLSALQWALAYGSATGQLTPSPWIDGRILQALCEAALQHSIEVEQTRQTIIASGLKPRSLDLESWPWPIKIYTFGRFSVLREDKPASFASKYQKKPLELLRILIALGARSVDINVIMESVWPLEGPAARASFDVTLMRLRKMLGHPEVLILLDGRLTLNDQVCWVDCWAFERAATHFDGVSADQVDPKILDHYRGAFLQREQRIPCIANTRDRLAAKFERLVLRIGRQQEAACEWSLAADTYRRGLEQDNINEEFYRRLMLSQAQAGERTEAIKTYRRCRDMLSINLQAKPSDETETIYQSLLAQ